MWVVVGKDSLGHKSPEEYSAPNPAIFWAVCQMWL